MTVAREEGPRFEAVVVVASLGGLAAFSAILRGLPHGFATPILVALHRRPVGRLPDPLVSVLQRYTSLEVRAARDGDALAPGVTLVPGGHVATLDDGRRLRVDERDGLAVGDATMTSAAERLGAATIGVVLTGRLRDGTAGARAIKRRGGRVLAEDPTTARAPDMPTNAIATGCVDFVLPLARIAPALVTLSMAPGGADMFVVPTPPWGRMHA